MQDAWHHPWPVATSSPPNYDNQTCLHLLTDVPCWEPPYIQHLLAVTVSWQSILAPKILWKFFSYLTHFVLLRWTCLSSFMVSGLPRWLRGTRIRLPMQDTRETRVWSLGWEVPLEKGMATHSSILAWKIPWTEEPGRLQSIGSQSGNWLRDFTHTSKLSLLRTMPGR